MADDAGFLKYRGEQLRKINAIRRAASQPTMADIVPVLNKGQVLFTPVAELHNVPASCYTCKMYNFGRSCMEMGPRVRIRKFIYPAKPTIDAKRIEYWPCCSYHGYGDPNYGPEKFSETLGSPDNMGLIWINAPEVGQEYGGANCGGGHGGDDCDYYMTKGADKRAEPTAFCRVLRGQVSNGDVCSGWTDDDEIPWSKAQAILEELENGNSKAVSA